MDRNFIDYRLSYSKLGLMKFIGHIDTMKLFHKMFRMSGLPIAFSQGFNPHQIFTIAHPLALGMEGQHELADFRLSTDVSSGEIIARLNERTPSGLQIIGVRKLAQGEKNCAALVAAADYTIELDNASFVGTRYIASDVLQQAIADILAKTEMVVSKRTKSGTSQADIRPDIMDISVGAEGINMRISAGSAANLKPQLVVQEIFRAAGIPYSEYAQRYTRTQLLRRDKEGLVLLD
ncbi:MAG: TIGR03936 family radical SAM-associated protein [Defluviitaleaceae bacterium]|nr:TIGR03936 family radical SAM-associated protein [Defluviitaleaceae bacterium]